MKFRLKTAIYGVIGALAASSAVALGRKKLANQPEEPIELASTPTDLSWRSWRKALLETKDAIFDKNLMMLASGIAYGGTLAFFPLVVACVAIASIVITPEQMNDVVGSMAEFLPSDIAGLLSAQLTNALGNESTNQLVAVLAIALALFGVSGAMGSLVNGLNVAYERKETRGIVKARLVSVVLTSMMIVGLLIVIPLLVLGGDVLRHFGLGEGLIAVFSVLRWVILALVMVVGLSIVYRYAPDRENVAWQWVSWGAIMATLLWLLVTVLFFVYVQNFSRFSESYSLFAGIIVLMMWLNFSGLAVLIGAVVNNQLEKRKKI